MKIDLADIKPEDIRIGLKADFEKEISEQDILNFADVSGDFNPLHIDEKYASSTNYKHRIVHGAYQIALGSAMIGMRLPGKKVVLGSVNSRFPAPLYYPCTVKVSGEIVSWNLQSQKGMLKVLIIDKSESNITAEIMMGFGLHETGKIASYQNIRPANTNSGFSNDKKLIIITGAGGGIGSELLKSLSDEYNIIGIVNKNPISDLLLKSKNIKQIKINLLEPLREDILKEFCGDQKVYGIIHAAFPDISKSGLLQTPDDIIASQLAFGSVIPVSLARILFEKVSDKGGRFIVLGSTYGTRKPQLSMAAYSLGKAALEHTVRLLAPELARKKITINALCPSFVPIGKNAQVNDIQKKIESAKVPLGRLCSPEDISGITRFLLSNESEFLSGETICFSGGQI